MLGAYKRGSATVDEDEPLLIMLMRKTREAFSVRWRRALTPVSAVIVLFVFSSN